MKEALCSARISAFNPQNLNIALCLANKIQHYENNILFSVQKPLEAKFEATLFKMFCFSPICVIWKNLELHKV